MSISLQRTLNGAIVNKWCLMFRKKSRSSSPKGQSLVEMAISLMIILWLLAIAVDSGLAFFSYVALRDAAQEGALYATICQDATKIKTRAASSSTRPVTMTTAMVSVTPPSTNTAGKPYTVTVSYNYPISTPLASTILGASTIPLSASATSVIMIPRTTCP